MQVKSPKYRISYGVIIAILLTFESPGSCMKVSMDDKVSEMEKMELMVGRTSLAKKVPANFKRVPSRLAPDLSSRFLCMLKAGQTHVSSKTSSSISYRAILSSSHAAMLFQSCPGPPAVPASIRNRSRCRLHRHCIIGNSSSDGFRRWLHG
jgi:hypothetical protein